MKRFLLQFFFSFLALQPKAIINSTGVEHQKIDNNSFHQKAFEGHCDGLCNIYVGGTSIIKRLMDLVFKKG
jgi:hypothetical protein